MLVLCKVLKERRTKKRNNEEILEVSQTETKAGRSHPVKRQHLLQIRLKHGEIAVNIINVVAYGAAISGAIRHNHNSRSGTFTWSGSSGCIGILGRRRGGYRGRGRLVCSVIV